MLSDDDVALRSVADTARVLGLGKTTVYEMCDSGELEAVKIRRATRITQTSIDSYIKNAKRATLNRKPRKKDDD